MQLVDSAAEILRRSSGEALSVKEIAERAMAEGLITPRSATPWVYMAAAMRKELKQVAESGGQPRFEPTDDGRYRAVR